MCVCLSLQATSIRLPVESGTSRLRGFGYAEFGSLQELMDALSLSGEVSIGVCAHEIGEMGGGGGGGGGGRYNERLHKI